MTKITQSLALRAPGFSRNAKDDELPNEFMSGHALAARVRKYLHQRRYTETELVAEDYGWHLYGYPQNSTLRCEVVFSSLTDPDAPISDIVELYVSVEPTRGTTGILFWKKDISEDVRRHSALVFDFLRKLDGIEVLEDTEAELS